MILGDDVDNHVSAQIIYYLMKVHKMHYTKALSLVKERRISVKLAQWVHNHLKLRQMKSDEKSLKPPAAPITDTVGLQTTDTNYTAPANQESKP